MAMRDLIPWGRNRSSVPSTANASEVDPFLALHRDMNRLFDETFRRFDPLLPSVFAGGQGWPSLEVNATDKELRVSAEVPGLDEKDVEILLDDGTLTIRGEKKSDNEDRERGFTERYYGRFERRIALPFEVDESKAGASFKNGVLTIALPKSPRAQEKVKRITIGPKADTKH